MDKLMSDIWPVLLGAFISAIGMYIGFVNKMRADISVLQTRVGNIEQSVKKLEDNIEEKIERMEKRQDSHSRKNDEIIKLITDFKVEIVKQLGNVVAEVGKMASDINNLNRMVVADDNGVRLVKK